MTTLLETIETRIAELTTQYEVECARNYCSPTASYLLGQLTAMKEVRCEIKIAILSERLAELKGE